MRVSEGADGLVRLWIQHAGLGWLCFGLSGEQARGLAQDLEARVKPKSPVG